MLRKEPPLFSVIIPTHNRAKLLKKAIQSVIDQSFSDWELIVVDDGSTDETRKTVASFQDKRIWYKFQTHSERSAARNLGIQHASGQYICFLDDDDYYLENHLQTYFDALSRDGFPEKIYRNGFYYERKGVRTEGPIYNKKKQENPVKFAAFQFCGVCFTCIPRKAFIEDTFPEQFPHWQDTHLILRLLAKYPFEQNKPFTYVYVQHAEMGSQKIYREDKIDSRVRVNVQAIQHLFKNYNELFKNKLPSWTENYLVSLKYLEHANGALINRQFTSALSAFFQSVRNCRTTGFLWYYLKFIAKIPLKYIFDVPKEKS